MKNNIYKDILFGIAAGDALGVPVEFMSREQIAQNPVTDMIGYGTYNLPAGTWSDDSSLAFCLSEALTQELDYHQVAENFREWMYNNYWTPRGNMFDIGYTTSVSIENFEMGMPPTEAGCNDEGSNGNGSLMRILPLLVHIKDKPIEERFRITKDISSITHGHIRSLIACFYYLEFAKKIVEGIEKFQAYQELKEEISTFLKSIEVSEKEISVYKRLLVEDVFTIQEDTISGRGYVVDTIEASIWCLLTTEDYATATLKAVNLGNDTDTTGAVTGGLAGLLYGHQNIPEHWMNQLARKEDIEDLATRMERYQDTKILI